MKNKKRDIIQLLLGLAIVVLINFIASFAFERFDLTSENRYSLTDATKQMLQNLDDVVFVRVYLEGNLPAGFKRLRDETKEMLDEFRAYSKNNVEYQFINPSESPDKKTRNEVYQRLYEQGLMPTDLEVKTEDGSSNKIIWPGAIFSFKGKESTMQLLKSQMGSHPEVMLNNSIQQLEYEISSSIQKLSGEVGGKIAFIEGHSELNEIEVADITKSLKETYVVERVKIDGLLNVLDGYKAIVIAKPDSAFDEKDKFIIDQFIMKGGKALWLLDAVHAEMDSLQRKNLTMGIANPVNLDDMLFKYGVRVNPNLIMDLRSLPIPIVTGMIGNQPKQEFFPWYFFPLIMSEESHPIVKNLEAIKTQFVSSIDTVGGKGIRKTILLKSSNYTKLVNAPTRISFNILRKPPDEKQYSHPPQVIAVLLEGEFNSVFTNRIPPQISDSKGIGFREKSKPTKQIVISDGDIIRNNVNRTTNQYYPLEYDRYTDKFYGNKDFLLNCINYLCDDSGLIAARAKEFKLRMLDLQKVKKERPRWQMLNTVAPILLILLFGLVQYYLRKRKFEK